MLFKNFQPGHSKILDKHKQGFSPLSFKKKQFRPFWGLEFRGGNSEVGAHVPTNTNTAPAHAVAITERLPFCFGRGGVEAAEFSRRGTKGPKASHATRLHRLWKDWSIGSGIPSRMRFIASENCPIYKELVIKDRWERNQFVIPIFLG